MPKRQSRGWTAAQARVYLRDLMDERDKRYRQEFRALRRESRAALHASQEATEAALEAAKAAGEKAEQFTDEKLISHNQIRPWVTGQVEAMEREVRSVEDRLARAENRKAGMSDGWKLALGCVGFIATLMGMLAGVAVIAGTVLAFYIALHK